MNASREMMTEERKSGDVSTSLKDFRKAHHRHSHHDEELQRSQRVRRPTDAVGYRFGDHWTEALNPLDLTCASYRKVSASYPEDGSLFGSLRTVGF
ncbi:unnamed protein product [Sphagnum balticum]